MTDDAEQSSFVINKQINHKRLQCLPSFAKIRELTATLSEIIVIILLILYRIQVQCEAIVTKSVVETKNFKYTIKLTIESLVNSIRG